MNLNGSVFPGNGLLDGAALAAVTSFLLSLFKPFVEKMPLARLDSSTHDATLRLLSLIFNAIAVLGLAGAAGQLAVSNWLTFVVAAIGQTIGSQGIYFMLTRGGGSVNSGSTAKATVGAPIIAMPPSLRAIPITVIPTVVQPAGASVNSGSTKTAEAVPATPMPRGLRALPVTQIPTIMPPVALPAVGVRGKGEMK